MFVVVSFLVFAPFVNAQKTKSKPLSGLIFNTWVFGGWNAENKECRREILFLHCFCSFLFLWLYFNKYFLLDFFKATITKLTKTFRTFWPCLLYFFKTDLLQSLFWTISHEKSHKLSLRLWKLSNINSYRAFNLHPPSLSCSFSNLSIYLSLVQPSTT